MFRPIAELYQDPVIRHETDRLGDLWRAGGAEKLLAQTSPLGTIAAAAALTSHLEAVSERKQWDQLHATTTLLKSLPGNVLVNELGVEVAAWTYANITDRTYYPQRIATALAEKGYDPVFLQKSKSAAYADSHTMTGASLLRQYEVVDHMLHGALEAVPLPDILDASAAEGVRLSEKRIRQYGLILLSSESDTVWTGGKATNWIGEEDIKQPGIDYDIWIDTPVGAALTYKSIPQAKLGITARGTGTLEIQQLQKHYGKLYDPADTQARYTGLRQPRGLMALDWPQALVYVAAELAHQLGKEYVGIQAAKNIPSANCHLSYTQARRLYDDEATRLRFDRDPEGHWYKPTTDLLPFHIS